MNPFEIVFLSVGFALFALSMHRLVPKTSRNIKNQSKAKTPVTSELDAPKNEARSRASISPSSRGGMSMSSISTNGQQVISYSDDDGCVSVHAQDGNVTILIHNGLDVNPASEDGQALLHKVRFLK